ncbi:MAG: DUF2281 domain-containing protein [Treponema porcinum]|uniref:DUF2281 domain-containing protein n=1 Tax=Treponema porcinum TaxID=261392 RepID=UPI002353935F|nr:DUF2281 domain-containing protein [Treponema porcinum]MCI6816728.1 DUF2281 domain-containing protein [Treponema porcinum]MCI7534606.1 DUF2281 domain-containing protein [Treponema porcinum]
MSYDVLEKQIKALPEEYLEDVSQYVQLLFYKAKVLKQKEAPQSSPIKLGLGKGLFKIPDDIHFGDNDILEDFEEYV